MKKKKCIIYGGAGFIGSHIAEELLVHGYNVSVFDKLNASKKNVEHILNEIDFIEGDFSNEVDITKSLKNQDFVVHLVSSTLPASSNLNPYYDVESNLLSSIHLMEECSRQKVSKVVFISSGGTIYGNPLKIPIKENHRTNPTCSYGIIKLSIEKYFELYRILKGLDYTILRFANPFGERQNPLLGQGLIASLLYKVKQKETIEIWGDGKIVRDYFYIRDGVKAISSALKYHGAQRTFNISSAKGLSINQILQRFRNSLELEFKVKYEPSRKFDVKVNVLDNSLAKKYLKWSPETNFNEALKNTWSYILGHE
jgi:UDP-glucose 4-epimerase